MSFKASREDYAIYGNSVSYTRLYNVVTGDVTRKIDADEPGYKEPWSSLAKAIDSSGLNTDARILANWVEQQYNHYDELFTGYNRKVIDFPIGHITIKEFRAVTKDMIF